MKRFVAKRVAALGVITSLVIGIPGIAFAYYSSAGSNTGNVTTSLTTTFTVENITFTGPPLQPGALGDSVHAQVLNHSGAPLPFNQLEVVITGVTVNPPGSASQAAGAPPCTTADYQLTAPNPSPWQLANSGGTTDLAGKHDSALILPRPGALVPDGGSVVDGAPSLAPGDAMLTPFPVLLQELDTTANQDACQGAAVQVAVLVNSPSSPGGPGGPGGPGEGSSNGASFVVTKSASPSTVYAGSATPITYTLTAQNAGGVPGSINISDTVPPGTTLVGSSNSCPPVSAPAMCTTSVAGSTVNWMLANVPAGATVTVTFEVTVDAGVSTGTISNTASWSGPGCTASVACPTNTTSTNVTAPLSLVISASPTTTLYGSGTPTVTPIYAPSIGSPLTSPPTCHSTVTVATPAGSYAGANTCSGASDPAYVITYAPGTASVHPAPLTITASSGSFTQGGNVPAITAQYSGFENGDTSSSLTTPPACSTTATSSSAPGAYPSTCGGAVDPNYAITYVPGSVTVSAAPATLAATSTPTGSTTPQGSTTSGGASLSTTSASTSPAVAFTGALLSEEWLIGGMALLLGAGLMVAARWRRRKPEGA